MEQLENNKKEKSRNIPLYDFFEILQLEYIVAELRAKLYAKQKDKSYWKRVMTGKKETILNIADKNRLVSMFDDEDYRRTLEDKIFNVQGLPNFIYKDDNHKMNQEYYDLFYYYSKGSDVRFEYMDGLKVGKIKEQYKPFESTLLVEVRDTGEVIQMSIDKVTRIL